MLRDFVINDWCYENKQVFEFIDQMSPEERVMFNCNPRTIDWRR